MLLFNVCLGSRSRQEAKASISMSLENCTISHPNTEVGGTAVVKKTQNTSNLKHLGTDVC